MVVTKKIEAAYWIVPILVIILITIPPLALGILGWSKYNGCYISEAYIDNFQVAIVIVFIKLNRKAVLVNSQKLKSSSESTLKTIKTIKVLGYRILLYPIVMLITNFAGIVSQFYYDFNSEPSAFLDNWTSITYPLMGALNFVAFCCDPTVHDATKVIIYNIKVRRNCKKDNDDQPGMELDVINSTLEESVNARNPNDDNVDDEVFNNPIECI